MPSTSVRTCFVVSSCIEENVSVCTALDASPVSPCCWCRLVDADAVGGTWPTPTCQVNYRVESVDPMSGRVQDESLLTHLMRHTGFWFSFFLYRNISGVAPKFITGGKSKFKNCRQAQRTAEHNQSTKVCQPLTQQ